MLRKYFYSLTCIAVLVAAMSFIIPGKAKLTLQFENYVGDLPLKLDSVTYKNELEQTYTVSKLKYYISNIHLQKKNGEEYTSSEDFLVNEEEGASKQLTLTNVPEGDYTSISFTVGVDSLHNCNGAQDGALDPVNGMFWTWNNGYVFLKMEGRSSSSHSPGNLLEFHIGGYKQPYNCIRYVKLDLNKALQLTNEPVSLKIKADLSALFKTPTSIDFSKISSVTDFHGSIMMADNYKNMFSIIP